GRPARAARGLARQAASARSGFSAGDRDRSARRGWCAARSSSAGSALRSAPRSARPLSRDRRRGRMASHLHGEADATRPALAALRARLIASGDLDRNAGATPAFDGATENAMRRFQERHGLDVNAAVGAADLEQLNIPAGARARQIEVNMERWRWLPQLFGDRYIMVNIPDFSLVVVDGRRPVLGMRVVVGKQLNRTPMFSDEITYLVFNPSWSLPPKIAAKEMLPRIQADRGVLDREHIRALESPGGNEVDPSSIDWGGMDSTNFHLYLKQD